MVDAVVLAIATEMAKHTDLIRWDDDGSDTGGIRCSCEQWQAPKGDDGIRPYVLWRVHVAERVRDAGERAMVVRPMFSARELARRLRLHLESPDYYEAKPHKAIRDLEHVRQTLDNMVPVPEPTPEVPASVARLRSLAEG